MKFSIEELTTLKRIWENLCDETFFDRDYKKGKKALFSVADDNWRVCFDAECELLGLRRIA